MGAYTSINGFEHVLCAHVLGEQWLAHRGNIDECGHFEEGPLRESDLVSVDLSTRQLEQRPSSRHRHATLTCLLPSPLSRPRSCAPSCKDVVSIRQLRDAASRGIHSSGQNRRDITGTSPSLH